MSEVTQTRDLLGLEQAKQRLRLMRSETRKYEAEFRKDPASKPLTLVLLFFGLLGFIGDMLTTYIALAGTSYLSESNSAAKSLMDLMGLEPYLSLAFFTSLLLMPLIFVRGGTVVAKTLFCGGVAFIGFKFLVALSNSTVLTLGFLYRLYY